MDPLSIVVPILAAAAVPGPNHGGAYGWICWAPVDVDGFRGSMLRHFAAEGEDSPYMMEAKSPGDHPDRPSVHWTIHPDPAWQPPPRKSTFVVGRNEAGAFRSGPDYISILFGWHTHVKGPVWAHYWGDSVYVGAALLMTAKSARKYRDKQGLTGGVAGGLVARPLLTALAEARTLRVVANDSTGKRLFSESFPLPGWRSAEAEFRRARSEMEKLESEFRKDHVPRESAGAACVDHDDPASGI